MKKHKNIFIFIFALFISLSMYSQHRDSRKKIKALKVSHITEKLNLSEKEAEKFWPVYNKFEKERYNLYHVKRNSLKKKIEELGGIDQLTEKEAKIFAKKMLSFEKANYQAHVNYQSALSNVISYKKIVKLQIAERDFNRRLFRRYKDQKDKRIKKRTN